MSLISELRAQLWYGHNSILPYSLFHRLEIITREVVHAAKIEVNVILFKFINYSKVIIHENKQHPCTAYKAMMMLFHQTTSLNTIDVVETFSCNLLVSARMWWHTCEFKTPSAR